MNKKVLAIILCVISLFAITACNNDKETPKQTTAEKTQESTVEEPVADEGEGPEGDVMPEVDPETGEQTNGESQESEEIVKEDTYVTKHNYSNIYKGGFYVDGSNEVVTREHVEKNNMKILNWHFDPYCPACVNIKMALSGEMPSILGDDAVVYYGVASFLNGMGGPDDTSDKPAAVILGVAEYAPRMANVYLNTFQSMDSCLATEDGCDYEDLKDLFYKLGGKPEEWEKIDRDFDDLREMVNYESEAFFLDPETQKLSGGEGLWVPFLWVEGQDEVLNLGEAIDLATYLQEALHKDAE